MLYTLRYKRAMAGLQQAFIEIRRQASPQACQQRAEAVGHAWCDLEPGRKYISCVQSVVADESILGEDTGAELDDDDVDINTGARTHPRATAIAHAPAVAPAPAEAAEPAEEQAEYPIHVDQSRRGRPHTATTTSTRAALDKRAAAARAARAARAAARDSSAAATPDTSSTSAHSHA